MTEIENVLEMIFGIGREVMHELGPWLGWALGLQLEDKDINAAQMALRAEIVCDRHDGADRQEALHGPRHRL